MELKKVKKSRKVIFAILSVACIVLSLVSPITARAEGTTEYYSGTLSDCFDFGDHIMTSSDGNGCFLTPDTSLYNDYVNNWNTGNVTVSSSYNLKNYGHYIVRTDGGSNSAFYYDAKFYLYSVPDDSFIVSTSNSWTIYVPISSNVLSLEGLLWIAAAPQNTNGNQDFINLSINTAVEIDNKYYRLVNSFEMNQYQNICIFNTDIPVYLNDTTDITSLDGLENVNSNYSGTDYSDILDHLTLYENSKMYISASSFNEGTLYIYPIMDDYQKEHSDAFYLRLVGTCSYNVRSNSAADTIVTWGGQKTRDLYNIGQQNKTISSSLSSSSGSYIDIPFNSISGGVTSYSMDFLNDSFPTIYDYRIKPLASSLSTTYDNYITTFSKFISGVKVNGFSIDPTAIYDGDIDVICSDCLYHFDLYVGNGDNISTSPVLSWDSDFVNGTGSSNFDNLSTLEDVQNATGSGSNSLPAEYYFSNDVPSYNNSVSGGGSSSSSSSPSTSTSQGGDSNNNITTGDNNQVVNTGSTNVTVNNDNGTAKYVPTILNKLLPNSEGDGGLSNDVQDLVNSNGWVTFMKTTYSFIPAAFWDKIVLYFGACLTITACAFLLRIILDLL